MNEVIAVAPKGLLTGIIVAIISLVFFGALLGYGWLVQKSTRAFESPREKDKFGRDKPNLGFDSEEVAVGAILAIFTGPLAYFYLWLGGASNAHRLSGFLGVTFTCALYFLAYLVLS